MSYTKVYSRINWENEPSVNTPLNASNLNKLDVATNTIDDRVIALDTSKVNVSDIQNYVASWDMNTTTGVITVTEVDGTQHQFDLNIEKIPVSFTLDQYGVLTMTTSDGTQFTADIGSMIPVLTFNNSSTVGVTSSGSGVNKTYTFNVVDHSIGSDQMDTDYLSDCVTAKNNAQSAAASSQGYSVTSRSWAVGGTNTRTGEDTNNAKYWSEVAQGAAQSEAVTRAYIGVPADYNTSTSYVAGDSCIYPSQSQGGTWYRCISPTSGTWDSTKWVATSCYDEQLTGSRKMCDTSGSALSVGSSSQAVYFSNGVPTALTTGNLTPTFLSDDVADSDVTTSTGWTSVPKLTSGLSLSTLFSRISRMFKNVRWLYKMLGTTDISSIGNGTVTGAISSLNTSLSQNNLDSSLNITSYTSTPYVFPKDGYVDLHCPDGTSSSLAVRIFGANDTYLYQALNGTYQYRLFFVRKGMKLLVTQKSGNAQALFYGLS
jgi:hypothetical protein